MFKIVSFLYESVIQKICARQSRANFFESIYVEDLPIDRLHDYFLHVHAGSADSYRN